MRLDSGRIEILNTGKSVFIGEGAGQNDDFSDNRNVFVGYQTGYTNTTGSDNTFIGYTAAKDNTTGSSNAFIGGNAGGNNTTGSNNAFVGIKLVQIIQQVIIMHSLDSFLVFLIQQGVIMLFLDT